MGASAPLPASDNSLTADCYDRTRLALMVRAMPSGAASRCSTQSGAAPLPGGAAITKDTDEGRSLRYRLFRARSAAFGLVGLIGELDRPQPQLLLYLGVGCDFCESAASPCQFAEIARVRYRYLPNRSYSWIPEEGGLFPLHPYGGPRPGRRLTPAPPPLDRDDRLPPPPVPSGTGAAPFEVEDLCRGAEPGPE